jgi:hypothetical protein
MLSRYSFFSPLDAKGLPVMVVLGDPSSLLYLDGRRPSPTCSPLRDTGGSWSCNSFSAPSTSLCPLYNSYKYGLEGLSTESSLYFKLLSSAELEERKQVFANKDIRFILGLLDVCNCNTVGYESSQFCFSSSLPCTPDVTHKSCCDTLPDGTNNALDVTCGAMVQGTNRLQRGLNYISYLKTLYPSAEPTKWGTFNSGHDNAAFYSSTDFQRWIDGDEDSMPSHALKNVVIE